MFRWQTLLGLVLGLFAGLAILTIAGPGWPKTPPAPGPILSESDGHLRDLVIHYEPGAKEIVATVYRDFLRAIESDITVHALCPSQAAFDDLVSTVGPVRCKLAPIIVRHPMTTWSRDRWVPFSPASDLGCTTLCSPRGEAAEELWPARAGDEQVGHDIATALAPSVRARRSQLYFDGGDFLADGENVFVVSRVLQRNIQHTVRDRAEFLQILSAELKRHVILLDPSPDHHAAMFMVCAGNRTMLVGDPSLARRIVGDTKDDVGRLTPCAPLELAVARCGARGVPPPTPEDVAPEKPFNILTQLPGGPDFTPETQRLFDAVADQSVQAGYKVVRVPVVPASDGRTYLTYANVLIDQQAHHRIVYLPFYRGAEPLNIAARAIWERLGYDVRAVDCTQVYRHFGCLHCLVNVLTRTSPSNPYHAPYGSGRECLGALASVPAMFRTGDNTPARTPALPGRVSSWHNTCHGLF